MDSNSKCQTCGEDWPEEVLLEVELFDEYENKVVLKKICPSCLEEYEENNFKIEQAKIFDPRTLTSSFIYANCCRG